MSDTIRKPEECNSCAYETQELTFYDPRPGNVEGPWLCDLCAGTLAGSAAERPEAYRDPVVLQTICYVGNVILDAIRDLGEK